MSSSTFRNRVGKVAVALIATTFLTLAGPAPAAHASTGDCVGGANGFVDIPDNQSGTTVRILDYQTNSYFYAVTLTLKYATIYGAQRGFARVDGHTVGTQFWMDWTTNGGSTWLRCGPFVPQYNVSYTTAAKITSSSSSYMFRACIQLPDEWHSVDCTSWW